MKITQKFYIQKHKKSCKVHNGNIPPIDPANKCQGQICGKVLSRAWQERHYVKKVHPGIYGKIVKSDMLIFVFNANSCFQKINVDAQCVVKSSQVLKVQRYMVKIVKSV